MGLGDAYCSDGYSCSELSDSGTCLGCFPDGTGGNTTTIDTYTPIGTAGEGSYAPSIPTGGSSVSSTGSYMSQGGNLIVTYSDGTFTMISPSTGSVSKGSGTPPPAQAGTVTPAQASVWPSLINALAGAGVRLGTVALLPAGASLTPNGTIVGSGQSLIGQGQSINSSFAAILTNPMVLIGGFGILALLVLSGGRR